MKRTGYITLLIFLYVAVQAQNRDSLWSVFNDKTLTDSARLISLHFLGRSFVFNNPDSSLYYAKIQEEFAQKAKSSNWLAFAFNTQGSAYTVKGDFRSAMDKFTRMLEIHRDVGDTLGMATAHNNIGNVYFYLGDYRKALENYILSQRFEQHTGTPDGLAISYLNIGSIYAQLDEALQAIYYFNQADSLAIKLENEGLRGSCLANIGTAYKSIDSLDIAYAYFIQAIPFLVNAKDDHSLAILYSNLADIYRQQGEYDLMNAYFDKSYDMRDTLGDQQGIARTLIMKGTALQLAGQFKLSRDACLRGLQLAESIEALSEIKNACECLYAAYKGLGDNETALAYYERMNGHVREMAEVETQRELQIMEFRRQVALDSIARDAEKQVIEGKHTTERNVFMIAGSVLLTLSMLLYFVVHRTQKSRRLIEAQKVQSDKLLLNFLPADVAKELIEKGKLTAREFNDVTVLFTDFIGFTSKTKEMAPQDLVHELNDIIEHFDMIVEKHGISKIKSIGDAYMAAGGLPISTDETVRNTVLAAIELQEYVEQHYGERARAGLPAFQMRAGLAHGSVVAGIVGHHHFQYDIWGDTVNLASRMEKSGAAGRINISESVYASIAGDPMFRFEARGPIEVKGKGPVEMWFVEKV